VLAALEEFLDDDESKNARHRRKVFRNIRLPDSLINCVQAIYRAPEGTRARSLPEARQRCLNALTSMHT